MVLTVGGWYGGGVGVGGCGGGEGGKLSLMPKWMGMGRRMRMAEKEKEMGVGAEKSMTMAKDGNGDIVHAVQQCGILLKENEEGCLRRFSTVATSSTTTMMEKGEREAWREVRDGLEALWRGLIESECKCHNPEMLDRMYEGLRERAGEMVGVGETEALEG